MGPGPNVFFVVCCNFLLLIEVIIYYKQHQKFMWSYFAGKW